MNASKLSRALFSPQQKYRIGDAPISIRESLIPNAGLGAFAKIDIEVNTFLGFYEGKPCTDDDDGDYVLSVSGYNDKGQYIVKCVDAQALPWESNTNWTRYINGIKRGGIRNVTFYIRGNKIGVKTVKKIFKGQELLLDYGPDYW